LERQNETIFVLGEEKKKKYRRKKKTILFLMKGRKIGSLLRARERGKRKSLRRRRICY